MAAEVRVGLDVDGVLYDFVDAMREWYWRRHNIKRSTMPTPPTWGIQDCWPHLAGDLQQFHYDCEEALRARHLTVWGEPLPDVERLLHELADKGHQVHIITARDFGCGVKFNYELTSGWFEAHNLPFTTLTISSDKTVVPTDVFLDDKPENVDAVLGAGTLGVMRTAAWNKHRRDLPYVETLGEFTDVVDWVSRMKDYCRD